MGSTIIINLKVPFNEKDQAKSLGARWNAEAKLWYVPVGVDVAPFEKWLSAIPNIAHMQAMIEPTAQARSDINMFLDDEMDDINARLRAANELNEDAF